MDCEGDGLWFRAQQFGDKARDQLLAWIGFENIQYYTNDLTRVQSADTVRGGLFFQRQQKPTVVLFLILLENDASPLDDGDWVRVMMSC